MYQICSVLVKHLMIFKRLVAVCVIVLYTYNEKISFKAIAATTKLTQYKFGNKELLWQQAF